MKPKQLYFESIESDMCYSLEYHLENARQQGLTQIELIEATPSSETNIVWCKELELTAEKSECNPRCKFYQQNGKSKICQFRGKIYEMGQSVKFSIETNQIESI